MNQKKTVINLLRRPRGQSSRNRTVLALLESTNKSKSLTESSESNFNLTGHQERSSNKNRVAKSKSDERRVKRRLALLTDKTNIRFRVLMLITPKVGGAKENGTTSS